MKLRLQFGLLAPLREINWWQKITDFPPLVTYKSQKWEFVMYAEDPTKKYDYLCNFSEVKSYDPNWHVINYYDLDYLINSGDNGGCECGAIYTPFPWDHMRYCRKWQKW